MGPVKRSSSSFKGHDEHRSFKGGRKQLRTIRKASGPRRGLSEEEANEGASSNEAEVGAEEQLAAPELAQPAEDQKAGGEAYAALLTLLKAEHGAPARSKSKLEKKASAEVASNAKDKEESELRDSEDEEEDEEAAIENALIDDHASGDDDDEDDGEHTSDDNGVAREGADATASTAGDDEEDKPDSLEIHFNSVPEKDTNALDAAFKAKEVRYKSAKIRVDKTQEFIFSRPTLLTEPASTVSVPAGTQSLNSYFIKQRLKIQNDLLDSKDKLTPLQKQIVDPMFQYQDLLYEYDNYDKETEYRDLYALHVLNHIYKTRDRILKNNQRLQENPDQELLDQGFTRPKVLIVAPTRDAAYDILSRIIQKSGLDQVDKKAKFKDQFFQEALPPSYKPKSFQQLFKGNTNDFFVLGAKFTRKTIKLYSNFYQSDIIICSPLGIQLILENTDKKKRQDDFLSSIELLVVDQLHSIEFQNMLHLTSIFEHINKIPQQQHDADFSRIKMWYINDQAKLFRQTLIFTRYSSPFANSLINGKCKNYAGRWKNHRIVTPENSSLGQLGMRTRLIFQRFDLVGKNVSEEPDSRFKHFCSVIVPNIVKSTGYEDGILLYIPDYTDFVRVRNYMREKTTILFGDINEYSEQRQLTSNRALFQQGRAKVLLYTERLHHFRRYEIKGVKTVIFYKPPTNPEFFEEVARYLGKSAFLGLADLNISVVRCLFSKLDGLSLERIVGTERAAVLTHGPNETYEFK
ncbi:LAQU0S13e01706g1_1 [Lachancea quebecensis]|uniref:U3 small nucleolar RNA-associated protein 25 n=1 Tax=Lachancea quebecensis TaxID=1654605 RepID=A0A0N7MM40_9SACH|nr:LAQU0S13e01706g1_1 [Lachancea quebecensis]